MMDEFKSGKCGILIGTMDELMDTLEYLGGFGLRWLSGKPATSPNFMQNTFTLPISIFYDRVFEGLVYNSRGDSNGKPLINSLDLGVQDGPHHQYQLLDMTNLFE